MINLYLYLVLYCFILFPTDSVFEFSTVSPLLNVACLLVTFVFVPLVDSNNVSRYAFTLLIYSIVAGVYR